MKLIRRLITALAAKDIGIILVTQDVARLIQARVEDLKLHSTIPLVVEIPSPEGVSPDEPSSKRGCPSGNRHQVMILS